MATTSANPTKQKRRNSEKRKEKSRDAARCRRSKESEIFSDLSDTLPLPTSVSSHLDKASIMRLSIAYLKARNLLGKSLTREALKEELDQADRNGLDSMVPKILEGFLLVLSVEGDIVYVTEDVSHHLGLPQIDLIGQSVYDYSHPCDHNEVKECLAPRSDGTELRSFFLRLKCTLTNKGRSVNLKSASYKVIHCTGRFVSRKKAGSDQGVADFLVLVGEPIPHPSNIEGPLDRDTFLTKHSLDMKYIYVDDKITQFLGYKPDELEGKSAFEFHHVLDNEAVLKHYKTMIVKGQIETPAYRFLAHRGGYLWVQTQATVIYGNRDSRPQAVVCLHKVLSEIEEPGQILSTVQAMPTAAAAVTAAASPPAEARAAKKPVAKAALVEDKLTTKTSTLKMFAPRTADMDKGYLIVNDVNGKTAAFKDEPEDLTHLAPKAGDTCIPLEVPHFNPLDDLFQDFNLTGGMLDCLPLTGFTFGAAEDSKKEEAPATQDQDSVVSVTASLFSKDPFFFINKDEGCGSSDHSMSDLFSPLAAKTPETYEEYIGGLPSPPKMEVTFSGDKMESMDSLLNSDLDPTCTHVKDPVQEFGAPSLTSELKVGVADIKDEEEDFKFRAPFIPMGDVDLSLFSCDDFLLDFNLGNFATSNSSLLKEEPELVAKPAETAWSLAKDGVAVSNVDTNTTGGSKRRLPPPSDKTSSQTKRFKEGKTIRAGAASVFPGKRKPWIHAGKVPSDQSVPQQMKTGILEQAWNIVTGDLHVNKDQKTLPVSSVLNLLAVQQDNEKHANSSPLLALLKSPASWKAPAQQRQSETSSKAGRDGAVYPLLSLTSYDCEVNAPLQPATGLLQGEDLLKALDVPLEFGTGD